ncbi:hypothetical protein Alide_3597 [Alicycliphilus denitrificans BC]|nr:hypothetical protein Alide_3597 [Alicycliphilus denitrificans BC]
MDFFVTTKCVKFILHLLLQVLKMLYQTMMPKNKSQNLHLKLLNAI